MSEVMDAFWQTPPIARTLAASTFVLSVLLHMGIMPFAWVYFHQSLLFRIPPQIWRLATCFMVTGPQLSIILDPYFIYSYVSQLERGSPRFQRREDVVWYLMFVCGVVLSLNAALGLGSAFLLQGLLLALAYTSTQDQRGVKANFFFITIPAQLVPYAMMFASLIMAGPGSIMLQLCGLVAAHLYDFLTRLWPEFGGGFNPIPTPGFLSRLVPGAQGVETQTYGTAIRGGNFAGGSSSRESGPLPDAWRTRGRGQRLGGDP